ncbi:hypothetical protein ABIE67_000704 [Streptomyces sp. V4I8]
MPSARAALSCLRLGQPGPAFGELRDLDQRRQILRVTDARGRHTRGQPADVEVRGVVNRVEMDDTGAARGVQAGAPDAQDLGGESGRSVVPAVGDDHQPVRGRLQRVEHPLTQRRRTHRMRQQRIAPPGGPQPAVVPGERIEQIVAGQGNRQRPTPLHARTVRREAVVQYGRHPAPCAAVHAGDPLGGRAQRAVQLRAPPDPLLGRKREHISGEPCERHP